MVVVTSSVVVSIALLAFKATASFRRARASIISLVNRALAAPNCFASQLIRSEIERFTSSTSAMSNHAMKMMSAPGLPSACVRAFARALPAAPPPDALEAFPPAINANQPNKLEKSSIIPSTRSVEIAGKRSIFESNSQNPTTINSSGSR